MTVIGITGTNGKTTTTYCILNDLYDIISDNDCEYVDDTCGNGCDRQEIAIASDVLQIFSPAEKVEIFN